MFVGVVCSALLMLSRRVTSLIMGLVRVVVVSVLRVRTGSLGASERILLDAIPTDPRTILSRYNLSGITTIYAACPDCHATYRPEYKGASILPSYPVKCTNRRRPDSTPCGATLLSLHSVGSTVVQRPIKPFVYHSVLDFIGTLSSREDLERLIDKACDDALKALENPSRGNEEVDDVFQGRFMTTLKGPRSNRLFIDRQGEGRFAFSLNIDFFNAHGNRKGGAATSCGIISLACLNLPANIRYKYENLHILGIIPGPREPDLESINSYTRPLIDEMVELWDPGVRLSRTALRRCGRSVRGAIVCVVCDLPAARKVAALAGHKSDGFLCSVCRKTRSRIGDVDDEPGQRSASEMRDNAQAWKKASTTARQDDIFHMSGVRYSELWRLPYWDPTRQLVVDPMHNLLLGITENHFRNVLRLTKRPMSTAVSATPAFSYSFQPVPSDMADKNRNAVLKIQRELTSPVHCTGIGDGEAREGFAQRLARHNLDELRFVSSSLGISPGDPSPTSRGRLLKIDWARCLASWVSKDTMPTVLTHESLIHIVSITIKSAFTSLSRLGKGPRI